MICAEDEDASEEKEKDQALHRQEKEAESAVDRAMKEQAVPYIDQSMKLLRSSL